MKLTSIILIGLLFPAVIFAHGVEYSTFEGGIGITVNYNTGQLISGAHVKVYSPDDSDELYQWGVTDLNGRFVFSPDKPGEWLIEINDGSGHGIKEQFTISDDLIFTQASGVANHTPVWREIVVGVSIIIGFSGIWFYSMAKRSEQSDS